MGILIAFAVGMPHAYAIDPTALFNEAVRLDLSGDEAAPRAFQLYRRAAEAGLPAAQFNVGVMLDSGRGTASDLAQAATWYARAAAHGHHRAAYNLGQLYAAGQGVPQNVDLARTWFVLSDLAAARTQVAELRALSPAAATLSAPTCVAPASDTRADAGSGGIELVWTAPQQPEPVRYFFELLVQDASGMRELSSGYADTSSVFVTLPKVSGDLAWRVTAVARRAGRYKTSPWSHFAVVTE